MNLTSEQIQAVKQGVPVPVLPPEVGEQCVLIRKDVYQRVSRLAEDFDPVQAYPAIDEAWKEGWEDPKMADYDHYEEYKK